MRTAVASRTSLPVVAPFQSRDGDRCDRTIGSGSSIAAGAIPAKNRLPSICPPSWYVEAGGLLSYGAMDSDQFDRAAHYVAKILKGANPADLPIQQPTRFELRINLKTAKSLGLTIPRTLILQADQVIE